MLRKLKESRIRRDHVEGFAIGFVVGSLVLTGVYSILDIAPVLDWWRAFLDKNRNLATAGFALVATCVAYAAAMAKVKQEERRDQRNRDVAEENRLVDIALEAIYLQGEIALAHAQLRSPKTFDDRGRPQRIGAVALDVVRFQASIDTRKLRNFLTGDVVVPPLIRSKTTKVIIFANNYARMLGDFKDNYKVLSDNDEVEAHDVAIAAARALREISRLRRALMRASSYLSYK